MTRVVSGAVLAALAVVLVWLAPAAVFFAAAECLLLLAFREYLHLASASGVSFPAGPSVVASALTCAAFAGGIFGSGAGVPLDVVLLSAMVAVGASMLPRWSGGHGALASSASALFPALYLGLPLGAMVAIRQTHGRSALFLLMLTVMVSDSAQYYSGRAFGRRKLAPAISPKKTVEGAVGGFICGAVVLTVVGQWWLPVLPTLLRAALGVAVVALGIAGDLFESMLKRSAGEKDSSSLIPGHGGVLDRIDALLFAAPVYYVVLRYV